MLSKHYTTVHKVFLDRKSKEFAFNLANRCNSCTDINQIDGVFGNIYPTEKLIQQFYATQQEERETVVYYGLRLESI